MVQKDIDCGVLQSLPCYSIIFLITTLYVSLVHAIAVLQPTLAQGLFYCLYYNGAKYNAAHCPI